MANDCDREIPLRATTTTSSALRRSIKVVFDFRPHHLRNTRLCVNTHLLRYIIIDKRALIVCRVKAGLSDLRAYDSTVITDIGYAMCPVVCALVDDDNDDVSQTCRRHYRVNRVRPSAATRTASVLVTND